MNSKFFKEYIDLYYSPKGLTLFKIRDKSSNNLPFRYEFTHLNSDYVLIQPLVGNERHFSNFGIRKHELKNILVYCQIQAMEMENYSDLEHLIQYGYIHEEKEYEPLFYTNEQLKYCIRKYGAWKVFKSKFKYNFYRRIYLLGWYICNLFGLKLYSKEEVNTAVFQACKVLRQELAPGENLEEKIMEKLEKKNENNNKVFVSDGKYIIISEVDKDLFQRPLPEIIDLRKISDKLK